MFSKTERRFLVLLARGPRPGRARDASLVAEFPNPTYRRKLLWGIRRKAAQASTDWHLYASAAGQEERVLPRTASGLSPAVPLFRDPILERLDRLAQAAAPRALRRSPRERP